MIVNKEPKYKDIKSNQDFIQYVNDSIKLEENFQNIEESHNMFNDIITEEDEHSYQQFIKQTTPEEVVEDK